MNETSSINWTDIAQAVAALIAIPGAIAAFILLFIRDRKRESEIQSLSDISNQLTQMLEASETRYRNMKKPRISVGYTFAPFNNGIILQFKNSNSQTTVTYYEVECDIDYLNIVPVGIREEDGNQEFSIIITQDPFNVEHIELELEYQTEEGYLFSQDVVITKYDNGVFISPSFIIEK